MISRARGAGKVSLFVAFLMVLVVTVLWILTQLASGADERNRQATEIAALQSGLDEANRRLTEQGEPRVDVPEVEPGVDTPAVLVPPTQDQILAAFAVWCDMESCHGSDGEDGEDAPPMTQKQLFAGFSAWCSTDPRCVGKAGTNGTDGADSTTPGPAGRPPTAEEVLDAVKVVCSDNACDGTDGTNGEDGSDGRGIAKIECHTSGDWIITLTDGTALTVNGPCRAEQSTPSPTPTDGN